MEGDGAAQQAGDALDALLDDALEDFGGAYDAASASRAPGASPAADGAPLAQPAAPAAPPPPSPASAPARGASPRADAPPAGDVASCSGARVLPASSAKAKALAFDPLARPPGRPVPAAAPGRGRGGGGRRGGAGPVDPGSPDLAQLAALLEHLASAEEDDGDEDEEEGAADAGHARSSRSGRAAGGDLAPTLRALADRQREEFAAEGSGEGAGVGELNDDLLAKLAEQFAGLAGPRPAGGDEDAGAAAGGMGSLVDTLMAQLLSKEVLYQPMKDIGARYPAWLDANRASLSPEDLRRYEEQRGYIAAICALYETDPGNFGRLLELLQEMQQRGQPPQEIVDELAPGMSFGPDGLPSFGGGRGGDAGGAAPPELGDCCVQ